MTAAYAAGDDESQRCSTSTAPTPIMTARLTPEERHANASAHEGRAQRPAKRPYFASSGVSRPALRDAAFFGTAGSAPSSR